MDASGSARAVGLTFVHAVSKQIKIHDAFFE